VDSSYQLHVGQGSSSLKSLSTFEKECVEFFVEVVAVCGVQRSVGQIYGLLFASHQPLSFTDIIEKLGISKGSASQGLQWLKSLGAVQGVKGGPDRRERFTPELGLRKLVAGVLRDRVEPMVGAGEGRMRTLRACADEVDDREVRKFSLRRVKQLETWRRQMWMFLPVLKTIVGQNRQ
jgi:DNA-binding transcriptional regulator GbsR (MarR family)